MGSPKSTAPRKRSMVAWRRRPIPRVMQCPRQGFCLEAAKKVQRPRPLSGPGNPNAETAGLRRAYLFAEGGVVHADFPAVGDLAA